MNLRLLIGISGLLFPLLTIQTIAGILPHPVVPQDPTEAEASAFFKDSYGSQQAQTFFHILGILWLGVMLVALYSVLAPSEPVPRFWSRLMLGFGLAMVTVKVAAMVFVSAALSLVSAPGVTPDGLTLLMLYHAGWYAQALIVYFYPFVFGALAFAVLRSDVLPAWFGWSAAALAILSLPAIALVMVMEFGFAPFITFMLLVLWSLVTGVGFLATSRREPATRVARAAEAGPPVP